MGSDGKSKKRRSSSISEDEGRSKKHRPRDERERKKVKSDKKEKTKSEKSYKHSKRHSDKGKKSKEKHDRKHHKRDRHSFAELSNDDYFSKNNEFATWLKEERGSFFSDLSSDAARELFQDFVKDWNSQKLESRYYEGIRSGPRTRHDWKISGQK